MLSSVFVWLLTLLGNVVDKKNKALLNSFNFLRFRHKTQPQLLHKIRLLHNQLLT